MVLHFLAGVTVLACLGYTVVNFVDEIMEMKYQEKYETDFLKAHDDKILKKQSK